MNQNTETPLNNTSNTMQQTLDNTLDAKPIKSLQNNDAKIQISDNKLHNISSNFKDSVNIKDSFNSKTYIVKNQKLNNNTINMDKLKQLQEISCKLKSQLTKYNDEYYSTIFQQDKHNKQQLIEIYNKEYFELSKLRTQNKESYQPLIETAQNQKKYKFTIDYDNQQINYSQAIKTLEEKYLIDKNDITNFNTRLIAISNTIDDQIQRQAKEQELTTKFHNSIKQRNIQKLKNQIEQYIQNKEKPTNDKKDKKEYVFSQYSYWDVFEAELPNFKQALDDYLTSYDKNKNTNSEVNKKRK